jgi:hypothetical protein
MLLAEEKCVDQDLESRVYISDTSTDFLGIVRFAQFGGGCVKWQLWTKNSLMLYHLLENGGNLILNVDATGGLLDIPGVHGVAGKILHTKIAISPKYALLDGKTTNTDDKTLGLLVSPLTAAEMISNKNTAKE